MAAVPYLQHGVHHTETKAIFSENGMGGLTFVVDTLPATEGLRPRRWAVEKGAAASTAHSWPTATNSSSARHFDAGDDGAGVIISAYRGPPQVTEGATYAEVPLLN